MIRNVLAAMVATVAGTITSQAQLLYSQDFDVDQNASGNWVTNETGDSPADLYFDYSSVGIPPAPNSAGTTRGVKINAQLSGGGSLAGTSVSPIDFSLSPDANFLLQCDVWINFNGPAPDGGSGSTQVGGIGFGTAATTPQIVGSSDSVFVAVTGEGGSSWDYRVYTAGFQASHPNGSPVYVTPTRNHTEPYFMTNFPGNSAPQAQIDLYPQQTGTTFDGTQGWAWRDFRIEKVGPFATWTIDGVPIATLDVRTNGIGGSSTYGGDRLLLMHSDINGSVSSDPNAPALAFSLFDNLRVSNVVANVVTVDATNPSGFEAGQATATLQFTRTITGSALTVNYTIGGLAQNGIDYTNQLGGALSGSITFGPSDSVVDLTIVPIDDTISEPEEDIIITVDDGVGYVAAGSASATITDNDTPLLILSVDAASMYERHTNDYASVVVTRWGDPFAIAPELQAANFTFGGDAVQNVDFVLNTGLFPLFLFDETTILTNLVNPLDNSSLTGNKTVEVGLVAGGGFLVSNTTAALTIIDDENPPASVLYTNALTDSADASNWHLTFENGHQQSFGPDYEVSFGYDLTTDASGGGVIASPPGGATTALRATVNKTLGFNAGMNLYMTNMSFSGNYAVRFNMNIITDTAGGTTQGPIFGINHDGTQTNWWAGNSAPEGGPWDADGLWYWISADGGAGAGDYILHTGIGGALPNTGWTREVSLFQFGFADVFKGAGGFFPTPGPYSGPDGPGLVANDAPALGGDTRTWTDVEIKQLGNVVTLSFNKSPVITYMNDTTFTSGYLMLGYADPFDSLGEAAGAVYYANLSVVEIGAPEITDFSQSGSDVTITFTSNDGTATAASFALESATAVGGAYGDVAGAVITQLSPGVYQADATVSGDELYFRIRQ